MKRRARFVVPILILAFGFAAVSVLKTFRPKVEARPPEAVVPLVRVVTAQRSDVPVRVRTQGTVVPRTESDLVPQVA
ncbi:MAG TPA: efflux transporter periplasmic adaptor subunit, partial [Myxococcota bacterium]|nr:efflux transporter periplasmic adaptor subunit [Myxococcota bacterium]